jgi:hypothetical protein
MFNTWIYKFIFISKKIMNDFLNFIQVFLKVIVISLLSILIFCMNLFMYLNYFFISLSFMLIFLKAIVISLLLILIF